MCSLPSYCLPASSSGLSCCASWQSACSSAIWFNPLRDACLYIQGSLTPFLCHFLDCLFVFALGHVFWDIITSILIEHLSMPFLIRKEMARPLLISHCLEIKGFHVTYMSHSLLYEDSICSFHTFLSPQTQTKIPMQEGTACVFRPGTHSNLNLIRSSSKYSFTFYQNK